MQAGSPILEPKRGIEMWMYFNSDKAFKFLKENGVVFTLRPYGKRDPVADVVVDIRHKSRKTEFKACRILLVTTVLDGSCDEMLSGYVPKTGFKSLIEWKNEALKLSGEHGFWNLFQVVKIDD